MKIVFNDQCSHLAASQRPEVVKELHHGERHRDEAEQDVGERHADYQHVTGVSRDTIPGKKICMMSVLRSDRSSRKSNVSLTIALENTRAF